MMRPAPLPAVTDGRFLRGASGRWISAGIVLSVLLHVIVITPLMYGLVELGRPKAVDQAVVVELVVPEEPPPEESAVEQAPEPEVVPPPEPAVAKQAEEPQEIPETKPETAQAPTAEPEVTEQAGPEPFEEKQEIPSPRVKRTEAPAPTEEPGAEREPSTPPAPEPSVDLPPRPPRKPVLAETPPDRPAEAPPVETSVAQPLPPEAGYLAKKDIVEVSREQFLANLAVARDEAAQAEANPELWRVIRAVRAQVEGCWLVSPAEARNPKLSVDIAVAFDRSGQVTKAEVQEVGRMVVDDEFKAFATTAHGALKACSPFKLPAESYAIWRSFTMRFVPRRRS